MLRNWWTFKSFVFMELYILPSSIYGHFCFSRSEMSIPFLISFYVQRQADRIKRDKGHTRRGDDAAPQGLPESLVPVSRFHGSRLVSTPAAPYQQSGLHKGSNGVQSARNRVGQATTEFSDLEIDKPERPNKVARLSSGATIGAAIVEAESSLEIDVCSPALREAF